MAERDVNSVKNMFKISALLLIILAAPVLADDSKLQSASNKTRLNPTCRFCDMRYENMSLMSINDGDYTGSFIHGVNFSWSELKNSHFSSANLVLARMEWADFDGADFSKAQIEEVAMFRSTFRRADFRMANLSGSNLSRSELSEANLLTATLRNADLSDARISNASLRKADLTGADLSGARLRSSDFQDATLDHANLQGADLDSATMSGASMKDVNLSSTYISQVNFRKANLQRANFSNSVLEGVNFNGANLSQADLRGAVISDSVFSGTNLCKAWLPDGSLGFCSSEDEPARLASTLASLHALSSENSQASTLAVKVAAPGNLYSKLDKSRPAGAILETVDILLKQMGKTSSFVAMPTGDALKEIGAGKLDIASVVVPTPSAREIAWLSDPVITEYSLVMVPKAKVFPLNRVADLHNKRIGARIGYQYPLLDSDHDVILTRFRSDGEMIRALLFGKVDAILIGAISDISLFRTEDILSRFEILKMAVGSVPLTVAFAKKKFSQQDVDLFNQKLAQLKQGPEWHSLLDHNGLSSLVKEWPMLPQ
jgi:uncharacterized protein YjbI with pentapeptide repeats/ABC-type amino acid transport substrate-binding protein